jgi:D-3-phosphoglycerate dehydrogenase
MANMRILVADPIAEEGLAILREQAAVDVKPKMSLDELKGVVGAYDALVVRSQTWVPAEVIKCGTRLKVIGRAGVGVDNIDVDAATMRGIVVVNAPTGNTISAAEHTMGLMLALARNIPQANSRLKSGEWARSGLVGMELRNKTLGVIGLGNIGSEVAKRAQAFEMRVIAHDPFVSVDYARTLRVEMASLEQLLAQADVVTLHVPLTSSTANLIGASQIAKMKRTALLVNCARGGLVDEEAVAKAVDEGRLGGAAFDVYTTEPMTGGPLFGVERIVTTPHLGASTIEAQTNVAIDIAEQVLTVLGGRFSKYAVNAPYVSPELAPFVNAASATGGLASQLKEGQIGRVHIRYSGIVANYDCNPIKAAIISGLLQQSTEERINLVNVNWIAAQRGLNISEETVSTCQNYSNLLTLTLHTEKGPTTVSSTVRDNETHIVQINNYWLDIVPTGGYFLFCDHRDRPGLVGSIGTITGRANINISYMHLSRLQPRGHALLILALDEPLAEEQRQEILAIPDIHTARAVQL